MTKHLTDEQIGVIWREECAKAQCITWAATAFARKIEAIEREACVKTCGACEDTGNNAGIERDVAMWNKAVAYCVRRLKERHNTELKAEAMNSNETKGGSTAVLSSAELERKRLMTFASLCELLPADVHWGDPMTPAILSEVVMTIQSREREACAEIAEDHDTCEGNPAENIAYAIRERSNVA